MEPVIPPKIIFSSKILTAIKKLQNENGSSIFEVREYLRGKKLDVVKYEKEIELAFKACVDKGKLRLDNGLYKFVRKNANIKQKKKKKGNEKPNRSKGLCYICHEDIPPSRPATKPKCNHVFCHPCLYAWRKESKSLKCPVCQTPYTVKSCKKF